MKPIKYSKKDSVLIDLGTKKIYKYPTPTKLFDIARMVVNDRHPQKENKFLLKSDCDFVIYVTKGGGKIFTGSEIYSVNEDDVVFVPKSNKFAVEGKMEYITVDVPAFYMEQSEEVEVK